MTFSARYLQANSSHWRAGEANRKKDQRGKGRRKSSRRWRSRSVDWQGKQPCSPMVCARASAGDLEVVQGLVGALRGGGIPVGESLDERDGALIHERPPHLGWRPEEEDSVSALQRMEDTRRGESPPSTVMLTTTLRACGSRSLLPSRRTATTLVTPPAAWIADLQSPLTNPPV